MSAEKTVAISFRVTERFKQLLDAAAAREHRSRTNMLESLLFEYCEHHGVDVPQQPAKTKEAPSE
jgi:predicted transcriptional regulator